MGVELYQLDYTDYLVELISLNNEIVEKLQGIHQLLVNVNGYLYIMLFAMAGVGLFYLFYRFLRIFL